jgi:acyl carrier protein
MFRQALESLSPEEGSAAGVAKTVSKQIYNPLDIGATYFTTLDPRRQRRHQRGTVVLRGLLASKVCDMSYLRRRLWKHVRMSIRTLIISEFEKVVKEQNKESATLTDDLVLLESGLDSLCFAIIVARLEDALGFDPFSTAEEVYFPVTLGDFIKFYEDATK